MSIIAKYKFDSSVYADLIPEFNSEFTSDLYTVTDEVDSENSNHIIRTIESDSLPTLMRFGRTYTEGESTTDNRTDSLLEVLDMNTSGLTSCDSMFRYCTNLTSLNVSNFNTSNVTTMNAMFYYCQSLASLDVSNFDTSNANNMWGMFFNCSNLTSLDVSNFNTSNVTNMRFMFSTCNKLTSIDVSNWNTSNVTRMDYMFNNCNNLTSLDLSNFNTTNVADMQYMFSNCYNLTSLDVCNFDTSKVTDTTNMFNNTPLLTDIGMIYCDQSTINKIASSLPTDTTQTIWVEDVDVKDLTPVEDVEFKQYAKNTEIMLTSPLLEEDKLIVKDGKLYHYHKMGMVVFDGSENFAIYGEGENCIAFYYYNAEIGIKQGEVLCNNFGKDYEGIVSKTNEGIEALANNHIHISISKSKLSTPDVNGFKQWLSENPTTVVYQLAEPYYELISEDPLDISLIAESSDITNSSNIPLNMTINNKGLATIAMSSSTTYTVAFDKNADSEVVVNLCGNEVTTTDNIVEITTPSEIDDELIFYGDGIEISNVRLLEGSVSGDSVPRETFEGLKNSFEDGYIPENALDTSNILLPSSDNFIITFENNTLEYKPSESYTGIMHPANIMTLPGLIGGKTYTMVFNSNTNCDVTLFYNWNSANDLGHQEEGASTPANKGFNALKFNLWEGYKSCGLRILTNPDNCRDFIFSNFNILEGDWTHLTEEECNNLGKYKVEYKVTGKNKFDKSKVLEGYTISSIIPGSSTINDVTLYQGTDANYAISDVIRVISGTTYINNCEGQFIPYYYDLNGIFLLRDVSNVANLTQFTVPDGAYYMRFRYKYDVDLTENLQLEEGTTPTEYEPYKEYTKTFYLNSPLLEGDTIEDVNGVATHVKRYCKVIFDGSEDWIYESWTTDTGEIIRYKTNMSTPRYYDSKNPFKYATKIWAYDEGDVANQEYFKWTTGDFLYYYKPDITTVNGFKQWLQANPTTAIYQLASPIYETISTESILCDSYVNGHLDVDTNIPIEKVKFNDWYTDMKYLYPSTSYIVQFISDNIGKLDILNLSSGANSLKNLEVIKGLNKFIVPTDTSFIYSRLGLRGIGFNASNIQVVATDRDVDFGYFKGLQSSFGSELVTDEVDENYGKHKVEVKVVGKNKFNIEGDVNQYYSTMIASDIIFNQVNDSTLIANLFSNGYHGKGQIIKVKPNTDYTISVDILQGVGAITINTTPESNYYLSYIDDIGNHKFTFNTGNNNEICFAFLTQGDETITKAIFSNIQLEEGTQATEYEPYQEYTKIIYLNSPLLKGDTIEVHNGKLCHYHKMGMVMFDGSEDEYWIVDKQNGVDGDSSKATGFKIKISDIKEVNSYWLEANDILIAELLCDTLPYAYAWGKALRSINAGWGKYLFVKWDSVIETSEFKQWLLENPTTVVYELAEPYYEEIEPTQEDLIITSVKEGDLHIDTIVPISSKVTYNVNVQLLTDFEQSIVEQVQATQTTDLQSILDEEIDN